MPSHHNARKAQHTRSKYSTKRRSKRVEPAVEYISSRIQDVEAAGEDDAEDFNDDFGDPEISEDGDQTSSEDEKPQEAHSYANLLQQLKSRTRAEERPNKRRRLEHKLEPALSNDKETSKQVELHLESRGSNSDNDSDDDDDDDIEGSEGMEVARELTQEIDSDDDDFTLHDPFEMHYTSITETQLNSVIAAQAQKPKTTTATVGQDMRKVIMAWKEDTNSGSAARSKPHFHLKSRLTSAGTKVTEQLREDETDLMREMFNYRDIVFGKRSLDNASRLKDTTVLHCLNHVLKTRDRVLKNNTKLSTDDSATGEYRDQGFTRPKVLVLLPTKQACVKFVDSVVKLSEPDQQENRGRFLDTFSLPHDDSFHHKPDDFRDLFGGNHEEDFRVGLKFTRKTIKFFSGFYNSDIILASPLGLMRTITTGGGKKDSKKEHDADFLSSIEILVMDHTNALEMQNWQHVDYVFSQLNLLPKESHGCDFARARNWYLDGKAKYLRQTIILSDYITPAITALSSAHLHNIAGRVRYTPRYSGAMLTVSPSMPLTVTQAFTRFDSSSPHSDSDVRFKYFASAVLPSLLRNKSASRGTLIFVPTYVDFVRLRNHFSTSAETTSLSFGTISEYSSRGDVARARSHFLSGRQSIILYSERAHHYFRYKIKGVRKLIFYGLPENPLFWAELIESLGANALSDPEWAQNQKGKQGKGLVRALFSKWDLMKLERIVGTERVGRLISEREGDVFEFV